MLKHSRNSPHISDTDLVRLADGELPVKTLTATETHLRTCAECRARLDDLKRGADTYDWYHAESLRPSEELSQEWASVLARIRTLDERSRNPVFPRVTILWSVAAASVFGGLFIAWF